MTFLEIPGRDRMLEAAMDAYCNWREESTIVSEAFRSWADAPEPEAERAWQAYEAAHASQEDASLLYLSWPDGWDATARTPSGYRTELQAGERDRDTGARGGVWDHRQPTEAAVHGVRAVRWRQSRRAQVGMLRALYEREIAADAFVGTSIGALNAAFVASRPQTPGNRPRARARLVRAAP